MSDRLIVRVFRFLPLNLCSRAFGWFARWRRPRFCAWLCMWSFSKIFGIKLEESERGLSEFSCLLDLFTRRLKPGMRPVAAEADILVSPVDGRLGAHGRIEAGKLIQAKGLDYEAATLLGDAELSRRFEGGSFATLYLSPGDYHRIHAPRAGRVFTTIYEPGKLWPVNPPAVRALPQLFAVNERVTSFLDTDRGDLAVCMVGATNVGSIGLAYDEDFDTNRGEPRRQLDHGEGIEVDRGGDLGVFRLGSTVVLLTDRPLEFRGDLAEGAWLAMGSELARYRDPAPEA